MYDGNLLGKFGFQGNKNSLGEKLCNTPIHNFIHNVLEGRDAK